MPEKNLLNIPNLKNNPKIGVGVLIQKNNDILLGKRINNHGTNTWGPPGGYLEYGETFEACAIREVEEETGLIITAPVFIGITNNIFINENQHTVSIFFKTDYLNNQEIVNREPNKISSWEWMNLDNMPDNIFLPLKNLLSKNIVLSNLSL